MDILKKAYSNMSHCVVDENSTKLQDKDLDGSKTIDFPTQKSKEYTLRSVLFFLKHPDLSLKEYVTLCKKNNINPISYVDKASIISDIENYESSKVKGFFVYPSYSDSTVNYSIPSTKQKNIILIPYSLTSRVHMGNVEKLLTQGIFEQVPNDFISNFSKKILINEMPFEITNDYLKISDWNRVKAVFIENSDSPEVLDILSKCTKGTIFLSFKDTSFNSFKIEMSGSSVKNYQELFQRLIL